MERYRNKRVLHRKRGKFTKPTAADFGIGGVCPVCHHLLIRVYEGDSTHIDPRAFRYRCFTCEPETEQELKEQKSEIQFSVADFFNRAIKMEEQK
jgi:hypothetical protein